MIHRLKCWTPFFEHIVSGAKSFDVRKDDRGFAVGDQLDLFETNDGLETGRTFRVWITYVLRAPSIPGSPLDDRYVVLGIRR